jgi:hypothetical protein
VINFRHATEHAYCTAEVRGSIPLGSTIHILFFFAFSGLSPPSAVQCLNQEACAK